jgi:hypothetical protein
VVVDTTFHHFHPALSHQVVPASGQSCYFISLAPAHTCLFRALLDSKIKIKIITNKQNKMLRRAVWQGAGRASALAGGNEKLASLVGAAARVSLLRFNLSTSGRYSTSSRLIDEFDSPSASRSVNPDSGTRGGGGGLFNVPGLVSPASWGRLAGSVEDEVERLVAHVRQRTADNKRHNPKTILFFIYIYYIKIHHSFL